MYIDRKKNRQIGWYISLQIERKMLDKMADKKINYIDRQKKVRIK